MTKNELIDLIVKANKAHDNMIATVESLLPTEDRLRIFCIERIELHVGDLLCFRYNDSTGPSSAYRTIDFLLSTEKERAELARKEKERKARAEEDAKAKAELAERAQYEKLKAKYG